MRRAISNAAICASVALPLKSSRSRLHRRVRDSRPCTVARASRITRRLGIRRPRSGSCSRNFEARVTVSVRTTPMKLHAFDRDVAVAQAHHLALGGPGGDLEVGSDRRAIDDQRVIARRGERARYAAEHTAAFVLDRRGAAVHQSRRAHDLGAEYLAHRLLAEAHENTGSAASCGSLDRHAGVGRATGRRDQNPSGARAKMPVRRLASCDAIDDRAESPRYCTRL